MLLSDRRITEELAQGNIIIEPFDSRQLGTNSYDCRLGQWFFEPTKYSEVIDFTNEDQALAFWGEPRRAQDVIVVKPATTILAHTQEIVGARNGITTTMHARSSIGRSSLSVCKCAGVGDVGYISRWTMEISNHSTCSISIPVGLRICQIKFDYVGETLKEYHGKYGQESEWTPYDMLPRLYRDWDLEQIKARQEVTISSIDTVSNEVEEHPCVNHSNVLSAVACGKCGAFICPKCMIFTPVGVRCRPCAQLRKAPQFDVSTDRLLLAGLAGLGVSFIAWFIAFEASIFLWLLSVGIGLAVGEAASRVTRRRVSRPLEFVVGADIILGMIGAMELVYFAPFLRFVPISTGFLFAAAALNSPQLLIPLVLAIIFGITRLRQ